MNSQIKTDFEKPNSQVEYFIAQIKKIKLDDLCFKFYPEYNATDTSNPYISVTDVTSSSNDTSVIEEALTQYIVFEPQSSAESTLNERLRSTNTQMPSFQNRYYFLIEFHLYEYIPQDYRQQYFQILQEIYICMFLADASIHLFNNPTYHTPISDLNQQDILFKLFFDTSAREMQGHLISFPID